MTTEHAVHRLTAAVADWFALPGGTLREGDRADFVVIDPTGVNATVVYRDGEFRGGDGKTVKSGRFLKAGERRREAVTI